jgi:radical SAM protein with 4Fe4S-binding SPASM domain
VDKKLVKKLYDLGMENVQISLEGTEKFHNDVTRSPNSFKRVKKGIATFVSCGFNVYVTSVALRKTISSLPDLVDQLPEMGVYGYGTVRLRVHKKEDLKMVPLKRTLIKYNKEIIERCKDNGIELLKLYEGLGILKYIPNTHYPTAYVCNMGKIKMEILSNGDVVPCKSLKRPDFVVGNLLKDEVQYVWNHPIMKMFRYMMPDDYRGACGKCNYKQSCPCCRAVAYNLTGDIFGEDLTCYKLAEENNRKELL